MKLSREVRVGFVVTLGIVLLYFGFNYLKGKNLFSPSRTYYAVFDNVDQLMPSARVQVNGFQVGIIDQVGFLSEGSYKVLVKFLIDNDDLNIPKDSEAHIVSDLLGTRTLELTLGKSPVLAERGDTLKAVRDAGITDEIKDAIKPLKAQIENLAGSVDSVLTGLNRVFNKKTQDGLVSSFESVNSSIMRFEHTVKEFDLLVTNERSKLSSIFSNVASITTNLKNNNEKLSNVFSNMDKISDDIAKSNVKQTMTDLQESIGSLQKVLKNVENGQGSLGKLATDDSLYVNLDNSSRNLSLLLEDMKAHPSRYVHFSVFGKKEKVPKK
jgi:phospholipid/cholesterol/gamma-HCH transport system substrate-binding protein